MVIFGLTFLAREEINSRYGGPSSVVPECSRTQGRHSAGKDSGERKKAVGMQNAFRGGGRSRIPARVRRGSAQNANLKI